MNRHEDYGHYHHLNEERNIARAIESLRCCDEILILDSGSLDRTVELAANLGARVIEAGWRGYAGQKNWAAEQAAHDWILSLDADEALSEGLEGEIWNLKKTGPQYDAYTMPRRRNTWAAGFCTRAGTPTARCGSTTASKPGGWAISCMRACSPRAAWATCKATSCTSPATRFRSTCEPWTATPRCRPRNWFRARCK